MDDSAQQRLFAQTPGSIEPPEEGLYLGTSGWSYPDWEGTLYPEALPSGSRLAEYVKRYATVEIDSTFYGTPRRSTVEKWREIVPEGFLFAAKFPQEVTHESNLVGSEAEAESFVRTMAELGFRYAVEVRHRNWLGSDLPALLREHGVALTLIDYPRMPRMEEATTDFSYIRWLGDRREFPEGHTHLKKDRDDDLLWWSDLVDRFLQEGRTVFAYANNYYQNHSPSTLERFLELRRGER
jgi:uncharacterized protein YecE (DUF72 family)